MILSRNRVNTYFSDHVIPIMMLGERLTKAYDVTIQRYGKSHTKIKVSKMHILRSKFCAKFESCLWNFSQNFEPTHRKQFYELWYLRVMISYVLMRRSPCRWMFCLVFVLLQIHNSSWLSIPPNSEGFVFIPVGCTVEVWEWLSNCIQHFIMDIITYPCWD